MRNEVFDGFQWRLAKDMSDGDGNVIFWICDKCDFGFIASGDTCDYCHGTGYQLNQIGMVYFEHLGKCIEKCTDHLSQIPGNIS